MCRASDVSPRIDACARSVSEQGLGVLVTPKAIERILEDPPFHDERYTFEK